MHRILFHFQLSPDGLAVSQRHHTLTSHHRNLLMHEADTGGVSPVRASRHSKNVSLIFCLIIQIQFISDKWDRVPKKVTTTSHKCHFSCHSTSTLSNVQYCHQHHVHCWLQAPNDRQLARCDFGGLEGAATPARTHRCPKLSNNPDWEDTGTQNCLLPPYWWLIKWRLTD